MEQAAGSSIPDPLIGSTLDERYRVIRRIGRGGMGIVYLAQHVMIGRKYAIKTLSERTNASDEMVARFHREAVAAAAVGSDHVVDVTDMGHLPDGTLYIALEYLEGVELASAVRAEGPFSLERALKITCQLCDALAAVHEKGIVHRDLKPENLFLIERSGVRDFVKVLDFGICKLLEGAEPAFDPDQPALTRTNASLGTPQYMAPEQFQTSACVDRRADIHAVGAILYYMLAGKPPFDAPSMPQLYMRICVEPPPSLCARRADVPLALERAIDRALSKHPDDRFADAVALKSALLPFLPAGDSEPASSRGNSEVAAREDVARPTPTAGETALDSGIALTPLLPERRWRRPALAFGLVVAAISSMGIGTWALTPSERPPSARTEYARGAPQAGIGQVVERSHATVAGPESERAPAIPEQEAALKQRAAQAARPKAAAPASRASLAAPAPAPSQPPPPTAPEALPQQAPPARDTPIEETEPFHFPRRQLKSVF